MKDVNLDTIIDMLLWYKILATQWLQSDPCKTQTSQKSPQKFLEPTRKPKVTCTDNSLEFGKSCEELSWNHCTSTPHRSETFGIAERAVRRVKEGTSALLLQSGLDEEWWADSMECKTYLRNIQDLLSDGKTPFERRIGVPFNGPVIPSGAMVPYHPISPKHLSRLHHFGRKVLPGIFQPIQKTQRERVQGDLLRNKPSRKHSNTQTKTQIQHNDLELSSIDYVSSNVKSSHFGAMLYNLKIMKR